MEPRSAIRVRQVLYIRRFSRCGGGIPLVAPSLALSIIACLAARSVADPEAHRFEKPTGALVRGEEEPCAAAAGGAQGEVDPGRPYPSDDPRQGEGWRYVSFPMEQVGTDPQLADFVAQSSAGVAPFIACLAIDVSEVRVVLEEPIPSGSWTCIVHTTSGSTACVGSLPGDFNADLISSADDLTDLVSSLEAGNAPPRGDINRSGTVTGRDILELVDLLNGAAAFDPWNQRLLEITVSRPELESTYSGADCLTEDEPVAQYFESISEVRLYVLADIMYGIGCGDGLCSPSNYCFSWDAELAVSFGNYFLNNCLRRAAEGSPEIFWSVPLSCLEAGPLEICQRPEFRVCSFVLTDPEMLVMSAQYRIRGIPQALPPTVTQVGP